MFSKRNFEILASLIVLGAVFSQYAEVIYKVLVYKEDTLFDETLRYWGYMTIWTNTLVGLIFLATWTKLKKIQCFNNYVLQSATVVYIFIVAIIYHLFLRLAEFDNLLSQFNDFIFHTLTPAIYIVYWFIFVPKKKLSFTSVSKWMLYPAIYGLFVILKGELNNTYPYPFFDVNEIGYVKVLIYGLELAVFYVFLSYIFLVFNNKFLAQSK